MNIEKLMVHQINCPGLRAITSRFSKKRKRSTGQPEGSKSKHPAITDLVCETAPQRAHQGKQQQRRRIRVERRSTIDAVLRLQKRLHVEVENDDHGAEEAAEQDGKDDRLKMILENLAQRKCLGPVLRLTDFEKQRRFIQLTAKIQRGEAKGAADQKRDAPSPIVERFRRKNGRQQCAGSGAEEEPDIAGAEHETAGRGYATAGDVLSNEDGGSGEFAGEGDALAQH
jgi:hypothetical protein